MATAAPVKRRRYEDPHEDIRQKLIGAIDTVLSSLSEICPEYAPAGSRPVPAPEPETVVVSVVEPSAPVLKIPDVAAANAVDWVTACTQVLDVATDGYSDTIAGPALKSLLQSLKAGQFADFDAFQDALEGALSPLPRRRDTVDIKRWLWKSIAPIRSEWSVREKATQLESAKAEARAELDVLRTMLDIQMRNAADDDPAPAAPSAREGGGRGARGGGRSVPFVARAFHDHEIRMVEDALAALPRDEQGRVVKFVRQRCSEAIVILDNGEVELRLGRLGASAQREVAAMCRVNLRGKGGRRGGRGRGGRGGGRG